LNTFGRNNQMTMSLNNHAVAKGNAIYYSETFRTLIETHLPWLINHRDTDTSIIDSQIAYKYESDFYGLLSYLGIGMAYHWTILRVNGLHSPSDYLASNVSLKLPNTVEIDRLKTLHTLNHKMN